MYRQKDGQTQKQIDRQVDRLARMQAHTHTHTHTHAHTQTLAYAYYEQLLFSGWEYTVEATMGGYGPVEKTYHMCRRRRWLRSRQLIKDIVRQKAEVCNNNIITEQFTLRYHQYNGYCS